MTATQLINQPDRRTVLVTGGGSGIGRATALALAEHGLDVLVTGRRATALAETADLHPGIRTQVGDVADPADHGAIVAAAARSGRLDVVINNAGVGQPAALGQVAVDRAQQTWATNVLGPTLLTQAALPYLIESRGIIINISSTYGIKPGPGHSLYAASKAALEQLTRSWALELAEHGIRVNSVAPGPTESEALHRMGLSAAEIDAITGEEQRLIPLGRRGRPEDVVPWILALTDPDSWLTGQIIRVDGGYSLT
jgi:NAD(P)-dependent dehydrogenase (short-subunit alcohol dehydrogenase family)